MAACHRLQHRDWVLTVCTYIHNMKNFLWFSFLCQCFFFRRGKTLVWSSHCDLSLYSGWSRTRGQSKFIGLILLRVWCSRAFFTFRSQNRIHNCLLDISKRGPYKPTITFGWTYTLSANPKKMKCCRPVYPLVGFVMNSWNVSIVTLTYWTSVWSYSLDWPSRLNLIASKCGFRMYQGYCRLRLFSTKDLHSLCTRASSLICWTRLLFTSAGVQSLEHTLQEVSEQGNYRYSVGSCMTVVRLSSVFHLKYWFYSKVTEW